MRKRSERLRLQDESPQPLVDETHCHRALPDRRGDPLDRTAADVAHGKDSRKAGLEEQRAWV
jgi:hypothetical protein